LQAEIDKNKAKYDPLYSLYDWFNIAPPTAVTVAAPAYQNPQVNPIPMQDHNFSPGRRAIENNVPISGAAQAVVPYTPITDPYPEGDVIDSILGTRMEVVRPSWLQMDANNFAILRAHLRGQSLNKNVEVWSSELNPQQVEELIAFFRFNH